MGELTQLKELQKGLIAWYDFARESSVLYIGNEGDALSEYLRSQSGLVYDAEGRQLGKNLSITVAPLPRVMEKNFKTENGSKFDYIICNEIIETYKEPKMVIEAMRDLSNEGAICLVGMNNRMGIKYFCGDRDKYTERNFDGIEGYHRAYRVESDNFNGRMYDKSEIREMLKECEAYRTKFYSLLSDLQNPILLFAEDYLPKEDLATRIYPVYTSPESVFLEEEPLYKSLVENDMFHQMANAYLVEFSFDDLATLSDAKQVTSTMVRSPSDAMFTIIHGDGTVEKRNVYPEGRRRLEEMLEYADDLRMHGLKVIDMKLTDKGLEMPYIDAPVGQLYLKNLFLSDMPAFLDAMDHFRDLIMQSSELVGEDMGEDLGTTLKYGYIDMVPLNTFFIDGEFVFFDQEFRQERYPAYAIIARMVSTFYAGNFDLQHIMKRDDLYERYHLLAHIDDWKRMEGRFLWNLRNDGELKDYYRSVRRNSEVLNSNRQRINFSTDDYYRLFIDIFRNADTRKLILFGSGKFAERFLKLYGSDYSIYAVVDNNQERWGEDLNGIEIKSPEILRELSSGEYKVLICIKNYTSVMHQLREMGAYEYSVFDPAKEYPRKRFPTTENPDYVIDGSPKKYNVGYISGVFDLFHVGHLNLFRRAKELCRYLIVGVVSDKGVIKHKGVAPFVPFEERIDLVRSCRFVDEAVEIPLDMNGPKEAHAMYHFDVQFSGSDYINSPYWISMQQYLREHGADLVFFPYTKSTNSTNIRALIEKGLT